MGLDIRCGLQAVGATGANTGQVADNGERRELNLVRADAQTMEDRRSDTAGVVVMNGIGSSIRFASPSSGLFATRGEKQKRPVGHTRVVRFVG